MSEEQTFDLDEALTAIAERDDRASFRAIFEQVGPRVKAYVCGRGASEAIAEDVAQETMARIWQKRKKFDAAKGRGHGWVFAIARNLYIDKCRKEKRIQPMSEIDINRGAEDGTRDALEAQQTAADLAEALRQLPPEQASVIYRAYYEHQSLRKVAKDFGLPEGTVKARARAALKKLRIILWKQNLAK